MVKPGKVMLYKKYNSVGFIRPNTIDSNYSYLRVKSGKNFGVGGNFSNPLHMFFFCNVGGWMAGWVVS